MSKVAEAMETYTIHVLKEELKEKVALLEEHGYCVVDTEAEDEDTGMPELYATIYAEGLVDPSDVFEDILRACNPETLEIKFYIW